MMKVGIWEADWIGEPQFEKVGATELVIIDVQVVARIEQEGNQFRYSSEFGNLFRPDRQACIVAGLQRDGFTVYVKGEQNV